MRFVAIPFRVYKEFFTDVKVGKDNIVTGVLRSKGDKKTIKGELINNGGKSEKRFAYMTFCSTHYSFSDKSPIPCPKTPKIESRKRKQKSKRSKAKKPKPEPEPQSDSETKSDDSFTSSSSSLEYGAGF